MFECFKRPLPSILVYRFSASSNEEKSEWIECIQASIKEHKFYDIVAAKKLALNRKSLQRGAHPRTTNDNVELLSTNNQC